MLEQKRQYVAQNKNMMKEIERRKGVFNSTIRRWQQGFLANAFRAWKQYAIMGAAQRKKLDDMLKHMVVDEQAYLRELFQRWYAFARARVRAQLDLEKQQCEVRGRGGPTRRLAGCSGVALRFSLLVR